MHATSDNDPSPQTNSIDAVIEVLKHDVDRTLLRANLKLTPEQRIRQLQSFIKVAEELRRGISGQT